MSKVFIVGGAGKVARRFPRQLAGRGHEPRSLDGRGSALTVAAAQQAGIRRFLLVSAFPGAGRGQKVSDLLLLEHPSHPVAGAGRRRRPPLPLETRLP